MILLACLKMAQFTSPTNGKLRLQRRIDRYGVSKKSVFVIYMLPSLGRMKTSSLFTAQRKEASIALSKKLDFLTASKPVKKEL